MLNLCIKCNKKPIAIKKSKLCKSCYQKEYRENQGGIKGEYSGIVRIHAGEMDFIKNYFTHNNWIYEPVIFRLNEEKYTPDFYDAEENIFIEVAGTRQAYHKNKEKYKLLKKLYPKIKFEIRTADSNLLDEEKIKWPAKEMLDIF